MSSKTNSFLSIFWMILVLALSSIPQIAKGSRQRPVSRKPGSAQVENQVQTTAPSSRRSMAVSFDEDLVEGLNKNPFDSATQITYQNSTASGRLYRVKKNFKTEIKRLSQEMSYRQ